MSLDLRFNDEPRSQRLKAVMYGVWYRSKKKSWHDFHVVSWEDVGRLVLSEEGIDFFGTRATVTIRHVKSVSYGRQGRDFTKNWVHIEYTEDTIPKTALFADGRLLGWLGIFGGTRVMYESIRRFVLMQP